MFKNIARFMVFGALGLLVGTASGVQAQEGFIIPDIAVQEGEQTLEQMRKAVQDRIKQQEKMWANIMELRIGDMQRVCDLDDQQVRKLRIAAKGVVNRRMKAWREQMDEFRRQMQEDGNVFFGGNAFLMGQADDNGDAGDGNQGGGDDEAQAEQIQEIEQIMQVQMMIDNFAFQGSDFGALTQDRVWKKTVKRVLTEEQQIAYKENKARRTAFFRKATVDSLTAKLDGALLLTDEQREQLRELIDRELGSQIKLPDQEGFDYDLGSQYLYMAYDRLSRREKQLKEILDETQFQTWKQQIQQFGFEAGGGVWNQIPQVLFNGAIDMIGGAAVEGGQGSDDENENDEDQ